MIQISSTPTNTIITKAYSTSEWDSAAAICIITLPDAAVIDAALVMLTHGIPEVLKECLNSLTLSYRNFDFYNYSDSGKADYIYNALEDKDFVFVEYDKQMDSFEGLEDPEQTVITTTLRVDKYGTIQFKGWAKYTDEEYWTEEVSINEIFNK